MGCSELAMGERVWGPSDGAERVQQQQHQQQQHHHHHNNKQEHQQKQHRHSRRTSNQCKYYYSALAIALALLAAASLVSQTNCQTSTTKTDCARHQQQQQQRSSAQRQQRQFGGLNIGGQQQQQPSKPARSAEVEQEEFSLSSGPGSGPQEARAGRQQQQQQVSGQQQQANYTLLNQQAASANQETVGGGGPSQVEAASTTPAQPSDSIGSPVALQPPATTTSSSLSARVNPVAGAQITSTEAPSSSTQAASALAQSQPQPQQQVATSRQLGGDFGAGDTYVAGGGRAGGVSQPVSSSPSSISIITPLLGPPSQQQQQSGSSEQSMMKPIFVVGNPISERDYAPAVTYEQHPPTPATGPSTEQTTQQAPKAPKLVDETAMARPQQQQASGRSEKSQEQGEAAANGQANSELGANQHQQQPMNGPQLAYADGHLNSMLAPPNATASAGQPRLFQGPSPGAGGGPSAVVAGNSPRRPSLPPPVNQANAASGFRSPMSPSGPLLASSSQQQQQQQVQPQQLQSAGLSLQAPANNNNINNLQLPNFYQTSPPYASPGSSLFAASNQQQQQVGAYNKPAYVLAQQTGGSALSGASQLVVVAPQPQVPTPAPGTGLGYSGRRPLNITRVEHISAECSNDLIRAVIVFNGTFKGIIYSSGYVSDPTCLYVNGTGSTRYEFSIRLNQCGTLGREQLHQPTIPGEARRRDQVMWNTLSIQYNSIIEQEWDEHFRVSCEYGSDFWKTVSFSPFNVETNTGSPVVFTINPPQCQMDVLLGHGMGPKIAVDGPVTVGDPLTLLIHMKSEKAGYDILVKNCVAHNGGKQRMQLIDSNGCVVNERFISPFRGTYNDNDLRHVTLYAYLKAFRFTGSPVLYLECEIHMCQSACPPQMCYWRRLSKRSVDNLDYEYTTNTTAVAAAAAADLPPPVISDSLSLFKALQVRQESEPGRGQSHSLRQVQAEDEEAALVCYRHAEVCIFLTTMLSLLALLATIAITCCLRIRQLTRSQFAHNCLHQQVSPSSAASSTSSLSPSLLSPTLDQTGAHESPAWIQQQQQRLGRHQIARWNQRKSTDAALWPFGQLAAKVAPPHVAAR